MASASDVTLILNVAKQAGTDFISKDSRYSGSNAKKTLTVNDSIALTAAMLKSVVKELLEKQAGDKEEYNIELEKRDVMINAIRKENSDLKFDIDCASQYTRRENLKICGIPYVEGENLNQIAKDLYHHTTGETLDDKDISVAHRINSKQDQEDTTQTTPSGRTVKIPSIIVRYTVRDIKTAQLKTKKNIKDTPGYQYPTATVYEDVTPI